MAHQQRVQIPGVITSGMECHLFSFKKAVAKGLATMLHNDNPRLQRGDMIVSLQQRGEDDDLYPFKLDSGMTGTEHVSTAKAVAMRVSGQQDTTANEEISGPTTRSRIAKNIGIMLHHTWASGALAADKVEPINTEGFDDKQLSDIRQLGMYVAPTPQLNSISHIQTRIQHINGTWAHRQRGRQEIEKLTR